MVIHNIYFYFRIVGRTIKTGPQSQSKSTGFVQRLLAPDWLNILVAMQRRIEVHLGSLIHRRWQY